ncbi:hypothetical protein [Streptomyces phage Verabelle]|uniref:Uncharacterized protein n=1 Tax=Streptomyces phage Verabelle TaxID=3065247 RepID=A0AA50F1A8_9CAUD|nr:hypothetical protein [Streptomyces phage Verabelle]
MNIIEINETDELPTTPDVTDWDFATEKGSVQLSVLRTAAIRFSQDYSSVEFDDAYQEGQIFLALKADKAKAALAKGSGTLHRWIGQRLRDKFLDKQKKLSLHTSYEGALEKFNPEVY